MCLREGVANLNCYDAHANVWFTGRGKSLVIVQKTRDIFVKGTRSGTLKSATDECVVPRRWQVRIVG